MKSSARFLMGALVSALVLGAAATGHALAQDMAKDAKAQKGAAKMTVLVDNEKVRAFEIRFQPGDVNKAVPSASSRVVRALKGGTLLRTYASGKTQEVVWKTGEARFVVAETEAYTTKNIGKSDLYLYVVVLK